MFFQFARWMERIAIPHRCCLFSAAAGFAHPAGRTSLAYLSSSAPHYPKSRSSGVKSFLWRKPQGLFRTLFFTFAPRLLVITLLPIFLSALEGHVNMAIFSYILLRTISLNLCFLLIFLFLQKNSTKFTAPP